jgi:CRP-like cAMP-binding protein
MANHVTTLFQTACPDLFGAGLKQVSFKRGEIFARQGEEISCLYLLKSGMASHTVPLADGHRIETATSGRNGAVGACAVFGSRVHLNDVVASLPTTAWAIELRRVTDLASKLPELRALLFRIEQYTMAQAQQIAACNACHTISQRFSRWILQATHESGETELQITQDEIAHFLGVQRASLSIVANKLRGDGIVLYRRGRLSVRDPALLERRACQCQAAIRAQFAGLFGSLDPQPTTYGSQCGDHWNLREEIPLFFHGPQTLGGL